MVERDLLLNASLALLVLSLLGHLPALRARMGRQGFLLVCMGAALPLLDIPLGLIVHQGDRIRFLADPVLVGGLLGGMALIAVTGALVAFAMGLREALGMMAWVGLGLLLNMLLLLLSATGAPLGAPFSDHRMALPAFLVGHPPLLVVLLLAIGLLRWRVAWRRWVVRGVVVLAGLYLAWGVTGYGVIRWRAAHTPGLEGHARVWPADPMPWRWHVVAARGDTYSIQQATVFDDGMGQPEEFARWDDQSLLLRVLGDPVVFQYYHRIFRAPVVRMGVANGQITMIMQELHDQVQRVPGPTVYLESDLSGENRYYQLQRFE